MDPEGQDLDPERHDALLGTELRQIPEEGCLSNEEEEEEIMNEKVLKFSKAAIEAIFSLSFSVPKSYFILN